MKNVLYILTTVFTLSIVLIACNQEKAELQDIETAVELQKAEDGTTPAGLLEVKEPVVFGSIFDDPECRIRRYTVRPFNYYCETKTPCGGGKRCKVVVAAGGGRYCKCK